MPQRIQRQCTKGWRTPLCKCGCGKPALYVGGSTGLGNRWRVGGAYRDCEWEREHYGRGAGGVAIPLDVETVTRATELRLPWFIDHVRSAQQAVTLYRRDMAFWAEDHWDSYEAAMDGLAGHDLACWCPLNRPCHVDVLLELANRGGSV